MSRTIEYKGNILIQYILDSPLDSMPSLKISEVELNIFFLMRPRLRFCVQKLLSTVDLLHKLLQ